MILHKKTSSVTTPVAGKVGGADWNDGHCYGLGELVQVAEIAVSYSVANGWYADGTSRVGISQTPSSGVLVVPLNLADIALAAGTVLSLVPFLRHTPLINAPCAADTTINVVMSSDVANAVQIVPYRGDVAYVNPAADLDFWISVVGEVQAA